MNAHPLRSTWGPTSGPIGFFVILLAPVTASAVFVVWTRVTALRLGYEVARAQQSLQALERENRSLGTTVSALASPERLRKLAGELGLEPPRTEPLAARTTAEESR